MNQIIRKFWKFFFSDSGENICIEWKNQFKFEPEKVSEFVFRNGKKLCKSLLIWLCFLFDDKLQNLNSDFNWLWIILFIIKNNQNHHSCFSGNLLSNFFIQTNFSSILIRLTVSSGQLAWLVDKAVAISLIWSTWNGLTFQVQLDRSTNIDSDTVEFSMNEWINFDEDVGLKKNWMKSYQKILIYIQSQNHWEQLEPCNY